MGIVWSAVPLPCSVDVVKSLRVAGQPHQKGTKSCRMGGNSVPTPSVHLPWLGSEMAELGPEMVKVGV